MSAETASKKYTSRRPNPVKNPGPPDRKAHAKLSARIGDYARMMSDPANRTKDMSGFKRPGSMQK